MITDEMCKLDCQRSLMSPPTPRYWQDADGEVDSPLWIQPHMPQWLGLCTSRDWGPVGKSVQLLSLSCSGWHCSCGNVAFPGHTFTHLSEGAQLHKRWQCQTKGTSGSKREWSADKGEDRQAGECRGRSWRPAALPFSVHYWRAGNRGAFVCLFCFCSHLFIYLFTFVILILSRFSQVKWEWLWVKHAVHEETWLWQVFTAQVYFQEYLMNQE